MRTSSKNNIWDRLLFYLDAILSHFFLWLPDRLYLSLKYFSKMGCWPDLDNPKSFSEKLQWLKIYDRRPEYVTMVDKYGVKDYVAQKIGSQYVIPLLGVWKKAEDIDFDLLPNQFVLKTTHGGGSTGVVICRDKNTFNKKNAICKLNKSLEQDIYSTNREWPYREVPKHVIAEMYIEENALDSGKHSEDLSDYKFFCFNGKPEFCQVIRDRHVNETIDFYNMDWIHQKFVGLNPVARNGLNPVIRPENLDLMIDLCKKLSKDIPFVRVDLYSIGCKVYFGELTFYPASGFGKFRPDIWNVKFGNMIELPTKKV